MAHNKPFPKTQKILLATIVPALMTYHIQALAQEVAEPEVTLDTMKVVVSSTPKEQVGEEIITRSELNKQNIQNAHDLVRYNTEVDVAEVGRYGNKGFAIRGVDGNRVAMNIDGVALPEVESNEIYSPYGYNYEGRFNPDLEMMGKVSITAGSDSLLSGSGAVGGSIGYQTKEPTSMVKGDGNLGGYAKVGYTSKNEELLTAVGLAGVYDKAEFLLNYAHREGHELKNHDMKGHDKARLNPDYDLWGNGVLATRGSYASALYPDASTYQQDSMLGKFYYHINDNHRLGLSTIHQKRNMHSYLASKNPSGRIRMSDDREEMTGYGLSYHYKPNNDWLDKLQFNYQYQDVKGVADTKIHSRNYLTDALYLSENQYRPVQTKNHQLKLDASFIPLDWGKLGNHQFKISAGYSNQDFTQSKPRASYNSNGGFSFADQGDYIIWSDAKKDIYSLVINDDIQFNDRLKTNLGIRYDYYQYNPYFQNDTWFNDAGTNEQNVINDGLRFSSLNFYENYRNGFYNQKTSFDHISYHGAVDYQIIPNRLTARYKIGTGFLAPTVTQMYSAFQGLGVTQLANTNIRPEKSLNQELEFEFKPNNHTKFNVSGYVSKYDDFIHAKYWGPISSSMPSINGCRLGNGICMQYMNLDTATVTGFKMGAETDLSEHANTKGKLLVSANYHTAKDNAKIETDHNGKLKINTLAATPRSLILGIDYYSPNDDWSLHGRMRGLMRKKAKDTKSIKTQAIFENTPVSGRYYNSSESACTGAYSWPTGYTWDSQSNTCVESRYAGYNETVGTYDVANRSKNVILYDMYGTKKFGKNQNIILNAGVYNLTDVKYIPWETLRQFANPNANSLVDAQGYGFNRYTAPGRNYALSLTYEF